HLVVGETRPARVGGGGPREIVLAATCRSGRQPRGNRGSRRVRAARRGGARSGALGRGVSSIIVRRDGERVAGGGRQPDAAVGSHAGRRNLHAVAVHPVPGETRPARVAGAGPGEIDLTAARRRGCQSRRNRGSRRVRAARGRGAGRSTLCGGVPGVVVGRDGERVARGSGQPGAVVGGHAGRRDLHAVAEHLVAGETRPARISGGGPREIDLTAARRRGRHPRRNRGSRRVRAARRRGAGGNTLCGSVPGVVVGRDGEGVARGSGQSGAVVGGHAGRRDLHAVAIHLVAGDTRPARVAGAGPREIDLAATCRRGGQPGGSRGSRRVGAARRGGARSGALGRGVSGIVVCRDGERVAGGGRQPDAAVGGHAGRRDLHAVAEHLVVGETRPARVGGGGPREIDLAATCRSGRQPRGNRGSRRVRAARRGGARSGALGRGVSSI